MKYWITLLTLSLAATVLAEDPVVTPEQRTAMKRAAEFRTFTTTNGTTIIGRPVDFSQSTGSLKLLTDDGSERVEMASLSAKDHAYIRNWHAAFSILDRRIKISVEENTKDADEEGMTQHLWYDFEIENKARDTTLDLIIEYCIYSQTKTEQTTQPGHWVYGPDGGFIVTGSAVELPDLLTSDNISGTFVLTAPYREEIKKRTDKITFYDSYRDKGGGANLETRDSELLGIRYRVYLPTPNGEYAMMEFAEPKKLLKETEWPSE